MPYKDKSKQREYQRMWVSQKAKANKAHAARLEERRRRDREIRIHLVSDIKSDFGCFFCDEDDPGRLDFHHVDDKIKFMNVSEMVRSRYAIERIISEIDKCICVCKNHHADLTNLRADYVSNQKSKGMNKSQTEYKRRQIVILEAKRRLRSHMHKRFKNDFPKLTKFVFSQ